MKKNLKDYLHHCLGCDVKITSITNTELAKIIGNKGDIITLSPSILTMYLLPDTQLDVLPILRAFSSITDEESLELADTLRGASHLSKEARIAQTRELMSRFHTMQTNLSGYDWANGIKFLLSKGFDVFGLIEEGLAIDKSTIKT